MMKLCGRVSAGVAMLGLALTGCAAPAQPTGPGTDPIERVVCGDGLRTVFSAEISRDPGVGRFFRVFSATQLPDGSVVLSYDADTPGAGEEGKESQPKLVRVEPDGSVQPLRIPDVQGLPVSPGAQPLAADAAGTLYVFDDTNSRVIAGTDDRWRSVVSVPYEATFGSPRALLGNDGSLYLVLTTAVVRVDGDRLTPVVGASPRSIDSITFPESAPRGLPGPAVEAILPLLTGAVFGADGSMYVVSQSALFVVSPVGLMTVLLDVGSADKGSTPPIPPAASPADNPRFSGVAIGGDGSIVIADTGQQRLLSVAGASVNVLLDGVSGMEGSGVVGSEPVSALLVERNGGEVLCAYDR